MIDTRYNQWSIVLFMNEIFLIKADQWRMLLFPIEQFFFYENTITNDYTILFSH
jgi:hypothetical protein